MGGFAKHMAHPYEYTDFTYKDIVELINALFNEYIEFKEKLDGFNIMATMNNEGEVVFIRNKGNINSIKGGMTLNELKEKYKGKDRQYKVFVKSAKLIQKVFNKLGKDYFNIDSIHRKVINCECIISPCTNIINYYIDKIAFHGYKIFEFSNNEWIEIKDVEGDVDDIYEICKKIKECQKRKKLTLDLSGYDREYLKEYFLKKLENIWKFRINKFDENNTIDDLFKLRFQQEYCKFGNQDLDIYKRILYEDKSVNLKELKKRYPDNIADINILDGEFGRYIKYKIIEDLDLFFLELGNIFIQNIKGFENDYHKFQTIHDLKEKVKNVLDNHEPKDGPKLNREINRLSYLNNQYNISKGLVFVFKERKMKLTGSFSCINQICGLNKYLEN